MIGKFPEVSNFNWLKHKLNWFICNYSNRRFILNIGYDIFKRSSYVM